MTTHDTIRAIRYADGVLHLLDQRALPQATTWLDYRDAYAVAEAIRELVVRGAPAIGIAAAYGVCLAARVLAGRGEPATPVTLGADLAVLRASRPTAVNLFWALDRMGRLLARHPTLEELEDEARAIEAEDVDANGRMGYYGASLIDPGSGVLTHCNTGSLATGGYGTALGVIRAAFAAGKLAAVYHTETRPWLQGARLTAWELVTDRIPAQMIADGAGAHLFASGKVHWLIVGADRICANGDTANKIGTLQLAIAARHHGAKVMVVAPSSTVDPATAKGSDIHIELRKPEELLEYGGVRVAAPGAQAWNPVFDVTTADLIDAIVTEAGVHRAPFDFTRDFEQRR